MVLTTTTRSVLNHTPEMIHILGAGAMGCLVAQELQTLPTPPPITLLFRNQERSEKFKKEQGSSIQVKRLFQTDAPVTKFQYQSSSPTELKDEIKTLFIATKTYQTQSAIKPYLHLITPNTDILLVQNGLGVAEELYDEVWPQLENRPNLFQGVINHGAYLEDLKQGEKGLGVTHAGLGDLFIARVPKNLGLTKDLDVSDFRPEWAQQLVEAKDLNTTALSYSDLLVKQVKKFIVNICVNSSTAILDCINGELDVEGTRPLCHSLIQETLDIFLQTKPVLKTNPLTATELDTEKLVGFVIEVATVWHGKNSSSMRQDTLNLRQTEVDYLTGFVVKEAAKFGLTAPVCGVVSELVRMRLGINRARAGLQN